MRDSTFSRVFAIFSLILLERKIFATTENKIGENSTIDYRLPKSVLPKSYEIKLIPEIVDGNFTFNGESAIILRIINETSKLTLHTKDLRIDENFTTLVGPNGDLRKPIGHAYVLTANFLVIDFDRPMITDYDYTLHLKWSGRMNNVPEGIYNSSYVNDNGDRVWLVATKFTQINARRAFPCWDEPRVKATFDLSIKHYSNYTAESNTDIREIILDTDGKQWTKFHVTPPMSTEILAFVVSDFDCLRSEDVEFPRRFSVCGRKDILSHQLLYASIITSKIVPLFENYFDLKYPLAKLSQFAVPDATTGATENWGLIIYRESSLTYEPFVHPLSTKEYVVQSITHELAHQWIGNYVTPISWKYSWIKEGLPTFLQYHILNELYPSWRVKDLFVTRVIQEAAFNFDSTDYYKNLEWDSSDPADIRSKFSPQIYNRGAAIFHMMSNMLGDNVFKSGVVRFVKNHAYGVFTSNDLWIAMQSAYLDEKVESSRNPNVSISEIMKPWIEQQGYPVVNVTRDYETRRIVIKQEGNLPKQRSNRWWIPINFATKSNPDFTTTKPSHWLRDDDDSLIIDGVDKDDWIIVNIQQSGYYRVDYDETNWKLIADYMNTENYSKINVCNRAQLINDLSYMASSNRQNYTTFLNLARYLVRENDYQPWLPTFHAIRKLRRAMYNDEVDEELKKFVLRLMEGVITRLGFEDREESNDNLDNSTMTKTSKLFEERDSDHSFLARRLRAKFLSFACGLGHDRCLKSAETKLRKNFDNATENPISPNLVSWVYCHGVAGSEEDMFKKINGSDIKYLGYLGCSPNKTVLKNYVDRIVAGEVNATTKQTRLAFGHLSEDSPRNLENAIDYFIKNYSRIHEHFEIAMLGEKSSTDATVYVASILNDYIWRTRTLDQLKKINEFNEALDADSRPLPPIIKSSIVKQTKKIRWSDDNTAVLGEWLHDHRSNTSIDP